MNTLLLPSWDKAQFSLLRLIFWIWLLLYSLQFFTLGVNDAVMDAFIHGPNLIFHEAGHIIFMPFGEFMTILGGSLMQLIVPVVITYVFLMRESDPYAASIWLWWLGQNLTDVALYISDAGARALPLIGGMSEEAHDWGNLLTILDLLQYDHTFWLIAHYTWLLLMTLALWWWAMTIIYTYVHRNPNI
jgi:hypothetical protein